MPVFDITCLTGSKEDSCSAQWKWCPSKGEFPVYLILVLDSGIDLMYKIFLNNLIKLLFSLLYKKSFCYIRKYKNESKLQRYILIN